MENLPILILLVPLAVYLIWDQIQWNKIHKEKEKIFKGWIDAYQTLIDTCDRIEKLKNEN